MSTPQSTAEELIDRASPRHPALPGEAFAGVNVVEADSAGDQFTGRILGATRGGWPPTAKDIGKSGQFGPVRLTVLAPPTSNGTAEPILVAGVPGRAVLGFMRIFPDGKASFGVEVWGIGAYESKPAALDLGSPLDVEFSYGSLYPRIGQSGWGDVPPEGQEKLRHTIRVVVNGVTVLDVEKDTPDFGSLPLYYGSNPVGGSLVNAGFSGHVLAGRRAPIGD